MINFQQILYALIAISVFATLLAGERKLRVGFFIATLLLATGYRRAFFGKYIEIHPSEILFWFVALLLVFQNKPQKNQEQDKFHLPKWLPFFMIFWLWGWALSLFSKVPLDLAFNQFKPFLILPLIFWLTWKLLKEPNGFYIFLRGMFIAGSLIGGLGLFEYYLPGVAGSIPGFSANPQTAADYMGFIRAHYSFYGAPTATFMLVITTPLALALWHRAKTLTQKWFLLAGVALQILGIYIGGYRSMWLTIGVEIILFVMLYRGFFIGAFGLIPLALIYQSLPNEALLRLSTLFAAAAGKAVDSSAIKRINRASDAIATLQSHPMGLGWATSGWVHNDILQIAVDLGIIAVLIFIIAYLITAFRLTKKAFVLRGKLAKAEFQVSLAILLSFIGSGFLYASQGITWQVFLVLPAWLIWALAEHWTADPPIVTLQENTNASENIRTAPGFQQRRYNPRDPRSHPLGGRDPRR
jgi:hypothetical protein